MFRIRIQIRLLVPVVSFFFERPKSRVERKLIFIRVLPGMMTGIVARAWQTVKPHVPMIRFRKGGTSSGQVTSSPAGSTPAQSNKKSPGLQLPVIEDWQLPTRFRRQSIDEKEIDAINSGGAY